MTTGFDATLFFRFFDPLALALVLGGSLLVACAGLTRSDIRAMLSGVMGRSFDAAAIRADLSRLERIVMRQGLLAIERETVGDRVIQKAVDRIVDGADEAEIEALFATLRADRRPLQAAGARYWTAVADLAPAMGMIGTIIGLIGMFSTMDDAGRIGPAMALAMLTTLYGVILSGAIAGPVAARLERLSDAERGWQTRALERLERLARVELARVEPVARVAPRGRPVLREAA